jgi:hypothetical protein
MQCTPITTADAVEAVLSGAWLHGAEIDDLHDILVDLQENAHTAPARIELRCVGCRILNCRCVNLSVGLKVQMSDHIGSETQKSLDANVFESAAHFEHTTFAEDVTLDGVIFREEACFLVTRFMGRASFDRVVFEQATEFDKSEFAHRPAFGAARFGGEASFVFAQFRKGADFSHSMFKENTRFDFAQFDDHVLFHSGTFGTTAQFHSTTFDGNAEFLFRRFRGPVDFQWIRLNGDMHFAEADLSGARKLSFLSGRLNGSIHLEKAHLGRGVEFTLDHLTRGPSSTIDLSINQLKRRKRNLLFGESSAKPEDRAAAARQYNMLRDNFRAMPGKDAEEDWCHYRYMDLKRRARSLPDLSRTHWMEKWARWLWHLAAKFCDWLFLKWCYGYGVYSKRIVVTTLAVILIFTGIYSSVGGPMTIRNYGDAFNPLYFSVITFTTIGYGDYAPLGCLRWAAGFEGLLGLFLMAIFTVSFARKIIR